VVHSYRTLLPLVYPPHSIALGSLYTASLLLSFEQQASPTREGESSSGDLAKQLNSHSKWEEQYHTRAEDLEGVFSYPPFAAKPKLQPKLHIQRRLRTYLPRPPPTIHSVDLNFSEHIAIYTLVTFTPFVKPRATAAYCPTPIQSRSAYPTQDRNAGDRTCAS